MKIKSKTCYFCLFFIVFLILFTILSFIGASESNDWKVQFAPYLVILNDFFVIPLMLKWYQESLSKPHILKVKNGYLIFDNKKYKLKNLKIKLKDDGVFIRVKLFIENEKLEILLDYEEFDRFLYLIKPYLKNPKIAENINFKDIKFFKEGFFIKHKKFFYDKIKAIEVYKKENPPFSFLRLEIFYEDKIIEKKISYNEENMQKIVFIVLKIKKPLSFKYLRIISEWIFHNANKLWENFIL